MAPKGEPMGEWLLNKNNSGGGRGWLNPRKQRQNKKISLHGVQATQKKRRRRRRRSKKLSSTLVFTTVFYFSIIPFIQRFVVGGWHVCGEDQRLYYFLFGFCPCPFVRVCVRFFFLFFFFCIFHLLFFFALQQLRFCEAVDKPLLASWLPDALLDG